ncbi:hypothetical protein [Halalkalibacterium ligniniphilum]|uniref:hypothetical protein n=1 Tax=Halalkalibacterium ligniniphilum TaxID=1134413 RepID=UPI000347327E|nr:hypothetical protein [Halalkalibacterium ligniniphilum]
MDDKQSTFHLDEQTMMISQDITTSSISEMFLNMGSPLRLFKNFFYLYGNLVGMEEKNFAKSKRKENKSEENVQDSRKEKE